MTIAKSKQEYNRLIDRFNKANDYFERTDISDAEKEKFLEAFKEILAGLNYYLAKIEVYTSQECMQGFK